MRPSTAWFVKLVTQPQMLPSQRKPEIDRALEEIVMRAIAKEPEDRYPSMAEFAAALDEWIQRKPSQADQSQLNLNLKMLEASGEHGQIGHFGARFAHAHPERSPPGFFVRERLARGQFLLGIILVITNKDGSQIRVETDENELTVKTPTGEITASTKPAASQQKVPPVAVKSGRGGGVISFARTTQKKIRVMLLNLEFKVHPIFRSSS